MHVIQKKRSWSQNLLNDAKFFASFTSVKHTHYSSQNFACADCWKLPCCTWSTKPKTEAGQKVPWPITRSKYLHLRCQEGLLYLWIKWERAPGGGTTRFQRLWALMCYRIAMKSRSRNSHWSHSVRFFTHERPRIFSVCSRCKSHLKCRSGFSTCWE